MYRTLTDPKLLRRLPHSRVILNYIISNLHGSFLNVIFQKNPPANIVFTMYAGGFEVMPTYSRLLQISVRVWLFHYILHFFFPQHFLYFFPLPHGHGSFGYIFFFPVTAFPDIPLGIATAVISSAL